MERKSEWRHRAKEEIKDWIRSFEHAVAVKCGGTDRRDYHWFIREFHDCMRLRVVVRPTPDTISPTCS